MLCKILEAPMTQWSETGISLVLLSVSKILEHTPRVDCPMVPSVGKTSSFPAFCLYFLVLWASQHGKRDADGHMKINIPHILIFMCPSTFRCNACHAGKPTRQGSTCQRREKMRFCQQMAPWGNRPFENVREHSTYRKNQGNSGF